MSVWLQLTGSAPGRLTRHLKVLTLSALLSLGACTTPAPPETGGPASLPERWQGRFSITLIDPSDQRSNALEAHEERAQGRFKLTQTEQILELQLFSPFGQTLANAVSGPEGAQLTTSDGRTFSAADPDTLIEQALGWKLPVSDLAGWLNGASLSAGSEPVAVNGWQVKAEQRFSSGQPRRLAARWPVKQRFNERRINLFLVVDRAS